MGSQRTFISENFANQLNLRPDHYEVMEVSVFGSENHVKKILPRTHVHLMAENRQIQLRPYIVPTISDHLANYDRHELLRRYPYLQNLDLAPQCTGQTYRLDVLIGADAYGKIVHKKSVTGAEDEPWAMESRIGYLIFGPTSLSPSTRRKLHGVTQDRDVLRSVMSIIADNSPSIPDYFEVEQLGILPDVGNTELDNLDKTNSFSMERYLAEAITQGSDKHYTAALPVNDRINDLPSYHNVCIRITREMARKMSLDKRIAYHRIIQDQLARGFIEYTAARNVQDGHYLLHYGVEKPSSSSTPLRIVYRCNFKLGDSPSLNDCLHPGIPLLQDLGGILMRLRLFSKVLTADIEKAFLQVRLREDHRKFTKFLWISDPYDPESPFVELQFTSVLFGASPSPFILNAVLHKHLLANDCSIASRIAQDIYVDNLICSIPTRELADQYYVTSNQLLAEGGFRLRAWASNDQSIHNQAEKDKILLPGDTINILGMIWDKKKDTLACKPLEDLREGEPMHPRSVLSRTARLFDVTGFLLPVHVRAKRLLQDFQRMKMKPKAPLPPDKVKLWNEIHQDLVLASSRISWPRQAIEGLLPETPVELHIFADSSKASLGSVAYIVANRQSAILWAKNTLIPVKDLSPNIPRYELNACVSAANLLAYIRKHIGFSINIVKSTLWSDSQIVLHWLRSTKKLEAYVQRRVSTVKNADFTEVRFCPTNDMPADLLTRGITTKQLHANELWWHGPRWLLTKNYPTCDIPPLKSSTVVGMVKVQPMDTIREDATADSEILTNRMSEICSIVPSEKFSSLTKLLRVTVLVQVFVQKLLHVVRREVKPLPWNPDMNDQISSYLTAQNLNSAFQAHIRYVQRIHYAGEIRQIKQQTNRKTPLVRQLNLFLDEKGILRKGSRMKNSSLSEETKYRIVLPRSHHFTELIIIRLHTSCLHDGLQHTLRALRSKFWVTRDTVLVKRILRSCVVCKVMNARHYKSPPTPDLPKWRLDASKPPFSTVGVDYTGEVWIKDHQTGERRKVYIVLYTCAVTRGVHLHYVQDQSVEQFLLSFVQFCSRKSVPSRMYSDNAKTFIAADEILQKIMRDPAVQHHMAEKNIVWQFIPKRAPWFGSIYERLIGIMKQNLVKTIGKAVLTEYELATVLTKIEANMNDRPLTRCTSNKTDEDVIPLTPAQLIYGRAITPFPHMENDPHDETYEPNTNMTHKLANRTLERMSAVLEHYWEKFESEYLVALMDTHKLKNNSNDFHQTVKVGDVVLVHEDHVKRPKWKMAVITKLLPGADGLVRAAEIRTSTGETNRPIVKLYPIELSLELEVDRDGADLNLKLDENAKHRVKENDESKTDTDVRPPRAAKTAARRKLLKLANQDDDFELDLV